jgi:predicted phage-related endonuclease
VSNLFQRRGFTGGSDARVIMGSDEADLIRLWREKRGEVEVRRRKKAHLRFGAAQPCLVCQRSPCTDGRG